MTMQVELNLRILITLSWLFLGQCFELMPLDLRVSAISLSTSSFVCLQVFLFL